MLQKRYQCNIDLANNVLRIQSTEIPFLAEHELPDDMLQRQVAHAEAAAAAASGSKPKAPASAGSLASSGPSSSAGAGPSSFTGAGQRLGGTATPSITTGGPQGTPAGATDAAREGRVNEDDVQTVSPHFRLLESRCDVLKGTAN